MAHLLSCTDNWTNNTLLDSNAMHNTLLHPSYIALYCTVLNSFALCYTVVPYIALLTGGWGSQASLELPLLLTVTHSYHEQCTVYRANCTLDTAQCTMDSEHCTLISAVHFNPVNLDTVQWDTVQWDTVHWAVRHPHIPGWANAWSHQ